MLAHHAPNPFGTAVAAWANSEIEAMLAPRLSLEWRGPGTLKGAAEFDRHRSNSIRRKPEAFHS
jgi:hypothetical protein